MNFFLQMKMLILLRVVYQWREFEMFWNDKRKERRHLVIEENQRGKTFLVNSVESR